MKKREPVLIFMEVLATLSSGPRGPTRLAQACNINYGRLENFTRPLLDRRLITTSTNEGQEVLSITEEGYRVYMDWLEVWRRLPLGVT